MTLHDVEQLEQLQTYYKENNLQNVKEKIDCLTKTMKIRAIRGDETETEEEKLAGLEELALQGFWRASW